MVKRKKISEEYIQIVKEGMSDQYDSEESLDLIESRDSDTDCRRKQRLCGIGIN